MGSIHWSPRSRPERPRLPCCLAKENGSPRDCHKPSVEGRRTVDKREASASRWSINSNSCAIPTERSVCDKPRPVRRPAAAGGRLHRQRPTSPISLASTEPDCRRYQTQIAQVLRRVDELLNLAGTDKSQLPGAKAEAHRDEALWFGRSLHLRHRWRRLFWHR